MQNLLKTQLKHLKPQDYYNFIHNYIFGLKFFFQI